MKTIFAALALLIASAPAAMADTYLRHNTEYTIQGGDNAVISTIRVGEVYRKNTFWILGELGTGYQLQAGDSSIPVVGEVAVGKYLGKDVAVELGTEVIYTPEHNDVDVIIKSNVVIDI